MGNHSEIPPFAQLQTGDVLVDFDFDSFLHDGTADDPGAFDFTANNYLEEPLGAE